MKKDWKLKNRRYLHKAKNPDEISVIVDKIQVGTSHEFDYIYVDSPYEVVFIVGYNNERQILMIRQFRYLVNKTLWEVPAGSPNPGESLEDGARREFEEEAGYKVGKLLKIGSFYASVGITNQINHIFLAIDLIPSEQHLEDAEQIDVEWISLDDALKLVLAGEVLNVGAAYGILLAAEWLLMDKT